MCKDKQMMEPVWRLARRALEREEVSISITLLWGTTRPFIFSDGTDILHINVASIAPVPGDGQTCGQAGPSGTKRGGGGGECLSTERL